MRLKTTERMEAVRRYVDAFKQEGGEQPSSIQIADDLKIPESTVRGYRSQLEKAGKLAPAHKVKGKDGVVQATKKTVKQPAKPKSLSQ